MPTPTPSPSPTCAPSGAPASTGIEGTITWNGGPVQGHRVEIRENTGSYGQVNYPFFDPPLLGTATTDLSGHFVVAGLAAKPAVFVWLVEQGPYFFIGYGEVGGRPIATCGGRIVAVGELTVSRKITGASLAYGATVSPAPLRITWDALQGATKYCVTLFQIASPGGPITDTLTSGACAGGYWPLGASTVTTPSYTTPALKKGGLYTLYVYAANGDRQIGILPFIDFSAP